MGDAHVQAQQVNRETRVHPDTHSRAELCQITRAATVSFIGTQTCACEQGLRTHKDIPAVISDNYGDT